VKLLSLHYSRPVISHFFRHLTEFKRYRVRTQTLTCPYVVQCLVKGKGRHSTLRRPSYASTVPQDG